MTPNEYRQKHKCCRTCKYCYCDYSESRCEVKDKKILYKGRRFCQIYRAKEFKE